MLLVVIVGKVGERLRVTLGPLVRRGAEGCERFERDEVWRDGGREALGQERPERLVLPLLQVAGGPVVDEACLLYTSDAADD